jgi:hypothetical protein
MVATSRFALHLPIASRLLAHTLSGRVRSKGGREWRDSGRHTVQGWRSIGSGEAHHQQATQARSEQEDSNSGQEYGHCKQMGKSGPVLESS